MNLSRSRIHPMLGSRAWLNMDPRPNTTACATVPLPSSVMSGQLLHYSEKNCQTHGQHAYELRVVVKLCLPNVCLVFFGGNDERRTDINYWACTYVLGSKDASAYCLISRSLMQLPESRLVYLWACLKSLLNLHRALILCRRTVMIKCDPPYFSYSIILF